MSTQEITIPALDDGDFSAYLAVPSSRSGPGLVVIQEIFGVNEIMRQIADSYAEDGYVAVVPDLFWRQEPGIRLNPLNKDEAEWNKAFELYQNFDEDQGTNDLIATLNWLRQHASCQGKVGSVGFCLGGKLAYLMATRSDADCSVSYYGVGVDQNLQEAVNIQRPLMLHIAENDQFVPREAWSKVQAELSKHSFVTIHTYPGVNHAFAHRPGSPDYKPEAAEQANHRTQAFFTQNLG